MANNEKDVEVLKTVVGKLDQSIERIAETSGQISQLLAVHERRLDDQEKKDDVLEADIKVVHKRITDTTAEIIKELHTVAERLGDEGMAQHKDLGNQIDKVGDRVGNLEKWKWYIVGALMAVAFLTQSPMMQKLSEMIMK